MRIFWYWLHIWVHQAIAFAIASEFCRKLAFARKFCSEDEIFAISFAISFAFASEFLRSAQFAAFRLRFGGKNSLANSRGASEFAFAFAAVSLRPRCTQLHMRDPKLVRKKTAKNRSCAATFRKLRCRNCTATFAFLQCRCELYQKLRCNKRKTALQHWKSCVAGKWRFPAGFKPPRLGTHVQDLLTLRGTDGSGVGLGRGCGGVREGVREGVGEGLGEAWISTLQKPCLNNPFTFLRVKGRQGRGTPWVVKNQSGHVLVLLRHGWPRFLQTPRPGAGVFASPSGPECPRECAWKPGCPRKCSMECLRDPSGPPLKTVTSLNKEAGLLKFHVS